METNLKNLELAELEAFFESLGEKKFRAKQVFRWIYKGVESFDEMTDISSQLREKLKAHSKLLTLRTIERRISQTDGTRKYLFGLSDGNMIESVFMKYKFGNSVCVSSQAGCKMGCIFCASGKEGFSRNLTSGEMADQVLRVQHDSEEKVNHVVVMGTGEPFDNYENLAKFIRIINDENGLNIGMRNITVSTCGIIPKIKEFANDFPQVNLAISLHASNETLREKIMPIESKYKFGELISACKEYTEKTRRRITFEYALIDGLNDSVDNAEQLAQILRNMLCHVNIIPLNHVKEFSFKSSSDKKTKMFLNSLHKKGISATVRRELGGDIDAACGQLRLSKM
jgi:23S rRNA (adenine2503-C2)-methyltransferase